MARAPREIGALPELEGEHPFKGFGQEAQARILAGIARLRSRDAG